jgi:hypothetical protein
MKKLTLIGLAAFGLMAFSAPAWANSSTWYNLTYTDGGANVASGKIDVVGGVALQGYLDVTAGTATGDWTLSPGNGSDGSFIWDNEVFPGSDPFLDTGGLLFTGQTGTADANYEINLWGNGPGNYSFWGNVGGNWSPESTGVATLTQDPCPDGGYTVALLGGALAGLQALRRKLRV